MSVKPGRDPVTSPALACFASDKQFAAEVGARNRPGRAVNIYLQFDGFDERTHREIRGRDLRAIKQKALDNCAGWG